MDLEQAELKIKELNDTIAGLQKSVGKISDEDKKKLEQVAYNKGFDKAKKAEAA